LHENRVETGPVGEVIEYRAVLQRYKVGLPEGDRVAVFRGREKYRGAGSRVQVGEITSVKLPALTPGTATDTKCTPAHASAFCRSACNTVAGSAVAPATNTVMPGFSSFATSSASIQRVILLGY